MKRSKRTIRREKKKKVEIQRSIVKTFGKIEIAATTTTHDFNQKKKKTTHDQSYDVPLDLIPEILSRLPAKSVVRFRAVCKHWYSITTTPGFIKSFTRPPSLLFTFRCGRSKSLRQLVFSFPQNSNLPQGSYESYQTTDISLEWGDPRSKSVHGLVLLSKFVIWNPTMRQFFSLPHPTETNGIRSYLNLSYLGYDPVEGKHKVLYLSEQPQVITLGAQESWRVITEGIPINLINNEFIPGRGPCFNGIMYFDISTGLICFDVRSEKFKPIKYPADYYDRFLDIDHVKNQGSTSIIPYEGRLALVFSRIHSCRYYKVDLCILEDADGDRWTNKCFLLSLDPTNFRGLWLTFKGVTEAGEFIFTSWCASSFRILYFDPRRNRIRDSLFHIHDTCKLDGVAIIPNHIESLLST